MARSSPQKRDSYVDPTPVDKIIERFNKVSYWIATLIVTAGSPEKQMKVIKKFISVAQHSREHRNFNTVMQVVAGLSLSVVNNLTEAWEVSVDSIIVITLRSF
jgi:hypothetical protein